MTDHLTSDQPDLCLAPDFLDADFLDFDIQYGINLRLDPEVRDNYKNSFRLIYDGRGAGFIDATGKWHQVPSATRSVFKRTITSFFAGYDARTTVQHVLIFCDAQGRAVLRLPSYGWASAELQEFCSRAGWDSDLSNERIKMEESWKQFPDITKCLVAHVRGPLTDGTIFARHVRHFVSRFKKRGVAKDS